MAKSIKSKIYNIIDEIKDEAVLQMVMEDIAVYTSRKDITDELSPDQQKELDAALLEIDKKEGISWEAFKQELSSWRQK